MASGSFSGDVAGVNLEGITCEGQTVRSLWADDYMLRGNIPAKVDEKGRLKIPAAFLEELKGFGGQFYVTSETGEYARIFPMKIWEELESKLARLSSHNKTKQKFLTWTNYYGQAVEIDGQDES